MTDAIVIAVTAVLAAVALVLLVIRIRQCIRLSKVNSELTNGNTMMQTSYDRYHESLNAFVSAFDRAMDQVKYIPDRTNTTSKLRTRKGAANRIHPHWNDAFIGSVACDHHHMAKPCPLHSRIDTIRMWE